jgi:ketosteroid isomerase-like protein
MQGRSRLMTCAGSALASSSNLMRWEYEVAERYQTQDPEVVIVEMRAKGTLTTTGRSFAATAIQIFRIREGQIVLFRDFANPRVLEDVIREPRPES